MAVTLWPVVTNSWPRGLLGLYPIAMGFVLVYGGEHYVIDVLAGWCCLGIAILLARLWEGARTS